MAVVANQVDYFNLISGSGLAVKDSNVSFDSVFSWPFVSLFMYNMMIYVYSQINNELRQIVVVANQVDYFNSLSPATKSNSTQISRTTRMRNSQSKCFRVQEFLKENVLRSYFTHIFLKRKMYSPFPQRKMYSEYKSFPQKQMYQGKRVFLKKMYSGHMSFPQKRMYLEYKSFLQK